MLEYETVNCAASRSVVSGTSFPSVLITTAGEPDTWAWKKISFFWRYFFTISSLLWASLPPTTRNPSDEKNHLNCSNHFCFGFWIFLLILGVSFFPVNFFVSSIAISAPFIFPDNFFFRSLQTWEIWVTGSRLSSFISSLAINRLI